MALNNSMRAGRLVALCTALLAVMVLLWSQEPGRADGQAMLLPVDPVPLVAVTASGERIFAVEIADDGSKRAAGLMFRQSMPDDRGMLFVFDDTREVGFWMKNTPMPLDLLFIGPDGRIKAIRQGEPQSEAVISPGEPVRYVLELKAGTAAKQGIHEGDLARHPAIGVAPVPSDSPVSGSD